MTQPVIEIERLQNELDENPKSLNFVRLAELYIERQMLSEAELLVRQSLKFHPRSVSGNLLLGRIYRGELNYAEGFWARRAPVEVWQYPIPEDASTQTVDWETYISNTQKRPFDSKRFFRWRNYTDYGTGMAGDLFVHLFSSLHYITESMGPNKIYASGGLRYWNDGREVPDVLLGTFDYGKSAAHPAFNLSLRCNFVDGTSGTTYLKLVGSEGSMDVTWDSVTLKRNKVIASDDPFYIEKMRKAGQSDSGRKHILPPEEITYNAEKGYKGGPYDHMNNWITAIRNNGKVTEDAIFGYRAAAPALLCNDSYYKNTPMFWDPEKMKMAK